MDENLNLLPRDYALTNICVSYQLLLSLKAQYHIWLARTTDDHPNLTHFICTLKSQYEIETKSGDTKKWKPLTGYMRI